MPDTGQIQVFFQQTTQKKHKNTFCLNILIYFCIHTSKSVIMFDFLDTDT